MKPTLETLRTKLRDADAIVIGAGAGLSASAGAEYGGETFLRNFPEMHRKYGYTDMYSAGFHSFDSLEEMWGYWVKMIDLKRYQEGSLPLYHQLLKIVQNKNYFVITTNVDHQFQLAGFDKNRLFYMQGDYGLFQCSKPCCQETFDNEEMVKGMVTHTHAGLIPSSLVPHCPHCGAPLTTNLRSDDLFVQDAGWYAAKKRYDDFIKENRDKNVVYLELGVGYSTPVWIKYPFMRLTYSNVKATYVVIDRGGAGIPDEIERQSLCFQEDIGEALAALTKEE